LIDIIQTSDDYLLAASKDRDIFEVHYKCRRPLQERLASGIRAVVKGVSGERWQDRMAFDAALRNVCTLSKRWFAMPPVEMRSLVSARGEIRCDCPLALLGSKSSTCARAGRVADPAGSGSCAEFQPLSLNLWRPRSLTRLDFGRSVAS
jgi:hypothetical protein